MAKDAMIDELVEQESLEANDSNDSMLDRPLSALMRFDWETIAWIVLMVVAVVSRFYDLGTRAMSHDESLHALYSFYLYDNGEYEHNPMMHGPLLFHANALVYFLFGDNDTTARIIPVLAGLATIGVTYLFRRYIGRLGALLAGVLILISPSLLFHSRYIRNDIYIVLFTVVWIYGAFRYLDTRQIKYLMVMTLGMAFGLVAKENHFITGAIMGAFFGSLWLWRSLLGDEDLLASPSMDIAVLMATLVLPFTAPFGHLALGWDPMSVASDQDTYRHLGLVGVTTLLSFGLAALWFVVLRKPEAVDESVAKAIRKNSDDDDSQTDASVWPASPSFADWLKLFAVFWIIQLVFFTTFFTNMGGLHSGVVGSLGYWIEQQEVARGGQPWFYYPMIGALYEFLPIVLSLVGFAVVFYWLFRDDDWEPTPTSDLPAELQPVPVLASKKEKSKPLSALRVFMQDNLRTNRVYFAVFGIWWVIGSWVAYTIAGEKMPWLLTHLALPMCFFGGWYAARLLNRIDWASVRKNQGVWLIGVTPAFLFLVALLVSNLAGQDRTTDSLEKQVQAVLAGIGIAVLLYFTIRRQVTVGFGATMRLLSVGLIAILAVLTVRFSALLTYVNYDMATEYLIYAHGGPDLKRALNEIDLLSERTVGDRNIVVSYDSDSSWPLSWYMRLYPNSKFYGESPNADAMSAPVIIVGNKNYDKVQPYVARDYVKRTYRQVWWPDQGYFFFNWDKFEETITSWDRMERVLQIIFYRRHRADGQFVSTDPNAWRDLTEWPQRHDFQMWVRRDIASEIWDLGVTPVVEDPNNVCVQSRDREVDLSAATIFQGAFGDLGLNAPRDVAVAPNGNRVIADSGNQRIVIADQAGNYISSFGRSCELSRGEEGGCVDPDGDGPLALGDGQFGPFGEGADGMWGVAVDQDGEIYVADTWNGRIQVFDSQGNFLRKWGTFGSTNGELGNHLALFGPRGIAIDAVGNLLVADTGNKRIIQFTPNGDLVSQVGGGGVIGGRFEEPVGVSVDPTTGSVYVADAWNQRVQKLSAALEFEAEYAICGWESQQLYHKPFVAAAPNGDVYASDPELSQIYVYSSTGEVKAVFGRAGNQANEVLLPLGMSVDPQTGSLLVADSGNNRVLAFPLLQ